MIGNVKKINELLRGRSRNQSDLTWWGWGGEVDSQIRTTAQILHVIPGEKS